MRLPRIHHTSGLMAPVAASASEWVGMQQSDWMWAKARLPMHISTGGRTDRLAEWVSKIVGRRECWWKKVVIIQLRVPCDIIINVHTCTVPLPTAAAAAFLDLCTESGFWSDHHANANCINALGERSDQRRRQFRSIALIESCRCALWAAGAVRNPLRALPNPAF
jgi:hypothetical protein